METENNNGLEQLPHKALHHQPDPAAANPVSNRPR